MNTIRRVWETPVISIQVFAPQECVAACSRISGNSTYLYIDFLTTRVNGQSVLGYYDSVERASRSSNGGVYYFSSIPNGFTDGAYTTYTGYTRTRVGNRYYNKYNGSGASYTIQLRYEQAYGNTYRYYIYNATS